MKLSASRGELEAKIADAKQKSQRLLAQGTQDSFASNIQEIVTQEIKGLEQEVAELEQEERQLTLIEQRLATQVEALSAHQEAQKAMYSATEARVQVRQELGGLPGELAELGVALEKAEQRSEAVQARASALGHLADLGDMKAGTALRDPIAQELANRYASEPNQGLSDAMKRQVTLGFKTLLELEYEYRQVQTTLTKRKETDPLSVSYIPNLAEETYRQGSAEVKQRRESEARLVALEDVMGMAKGLLEAASELS